MSGNLSNEHGGSNPIVRHHRLKAAQCRVKAQCLSGAVTVSDTPPSGACSAAQTLEKGDAIGLCITSQMSPFYPSPTWVEFYEWDVFFPIASLPSGKRNFIKIVHY